MRIDKTRLLLRKPIDVNGFKMKLLPLKEIIEMDYNKFIRATFCFYDIKDVFLENVEFYEFLEDNSMNNYQSLCYILDNQDKSGAVHELINLFIKTHFIGKSEIKNGRIYIEDKLIEESDYDIICEVIKNVYNFNERFDDEVWGGKKMKKMQAGFKRQEREHERKHNEDDGMFYKILSIVKTKANIEDIFEMNFYELIEFYTRLRGEKAYDALLTGIYSGNVPSESHKDLWSE